MGVLTSCPTSFSSDIFSTVMKISRSHSDLELVLTAAVLSAKVSGQCNDPHLNRSYCFLERGWITKVFSRSVKRNFRGNLLPNLESLQEMMCEISVILNLNKSIPIAISIMFAG